jgi:hypothetical protein
VSEVKFWLETGRFWGWQGFGGGSTRENCGKLKIVTPDLIRGPPVFGTLGEKADLGSGPGMTEWMAVAVTE